MLIRDCISGDFPISDSNTQTKVLLPENASVCFVPETEPQNSHKMIKSITLFCITAITFSSALHAQIITDTVSMGNQYANQKWYSLLNDEQGSAPKNNWDIAFECAPYGSSILINSVIGTKLWLFTSGDTALWSTLDTTGMVASWPMRYNSDTSWSLGAFSQPQMSQYDQGWGVYNPVTHYVDGDSLYVIKLSNNSYRKIWIKQLASGTFTFRYASLDNSGDTTVQILKSDFTGKVFGYYSIQNNAQLDREPLASSWDLLFTQYTAFIPNPYGVTGVLANNGILVAQAYPIDVTTAQWTDYTSVTAINEIGYDWKTFNTQTFQYEIADSLVYFVQDLSGNMWKVIFTGFGGSTTGNFIFTKEQVGTATVNDDGHTQSLALYPNPVSEGNFTVITSLGQSETGTVTTTDATGRIVLTESLQGNGLQQTTINTEGWTSGIYFVTVVSDGISLTQKLIVQ